MSDEVRITLARERKKGAVLKVIGVGGGGGNAINRMIESGLTGVDFFAVNTDIQDLSYIKEPAMTLQIGEKITKGLGTGSNAETGMQAALENTETIIDMLEGANMVFITAGMGGGTGTGASQVIANHSSSMGILTVAVVTKPFEFEGAMRMQVAEDGIKNLIDSVDAVIVIPNQKLFEIEEIDITLKNAYKKADDILLQAVRGISDIINNPGYQNVDFADVRTAMSEKGMTLMGTGESKGENRAEEATRKALTSPLLDNVSINGATGLLYNITASSELSLHEVGTIAEIIKTNASPTAKIKFGIVEDNDLGEMLRVTVIATGFKDVKRRIGRNNVFMVEKNSPTPPKAENKSLFNAVPAQDDYVFKRRTTPANLADMGSDYINENNLPSMLHNPDEYEDILDVPSFQRPKVTEGDGV